jgi:hypothetical protein
MISRGGEQNLSRPEPKAEQDLSKGSVGHVSQRIAESQHVVTSLSRSD